MALRTLRRAAQLASSTSYGRSFAVHGGVGHELARQLASTISVRGLHYSSVLYESFKVNVQAMGESISEGQIAGILKKEGDTVKEDDVIAQIETDKVTMDVKYTNKTPGVIKSLLVKDGDTVAVGATIADVEVGQGKAAEAAAPAPGPASSQPSSNNASSSSSSSGKFKKAVEPENTTPEMPKVKAPKLPPMNKPAEPARPQPQQELKVAQAPSPTASGKPERRVKMTRLRLRVAERLKGAQNTYAMLTTFNEVDMSGLMDLRTKYKETFQERHGVKLGFMSAFVKAAAAALVEIPAVNGVIDGDEIIYRDYYDISIAVATPKGLVVPVLRGVDKLSFAGVEKEINALGRKARDGTIGIDDMAGGTFTISNGGVYGSLLSTPIINPPQSAILGMHATNNRPYVVNGKIEVRPIMNLALTYDHRLIDGREAVTFLKKIKDVIEDPCRLLLDI